MKNEKQTQLPIVAFAGMFITLSSLPALAVNTLLYSDNFDSAVSTALYNPSTRATGTLASSVKYALTSSTEMVVNGTLNWDSNNSRDGRHEQVDASGSQNFRTTSASNSGHFNWSPYVAGQVWEVEFDQRVGWSHPLTFGLSDTTQDGNWDAWDNSAYDFAVGAYGAGLRYDLDNEGGAGGPTVGGVFPVLVATDPASDVMHHFRIRFDEPNGIATVWINGVEEVQANSLDFENSGRYLSWGEATNYAGALDNLSVSIVPEPGSIILLGMGGLLLLRRHRL